MQPKTLKLQADTAPELGVRGRRVGHVPGGTCRVVEGDAVLLLVGVLLLAFEYGVQCLPLALTDARDGPDRTVGTHSTIRSSDLFQNGHLWHNGRAWQNLV